MNLYFKTTEDPTLINIKMYAISILLKVMGSYMNTQFSVCFISHLIHVLPCILNQLGTADTTSHTDIAALDTSCAHPTRRRLGGFRTRQIC